MATLNLSVNVPDAQIPRVQAAARAAFGQVPNGAGGLRDMTNAEVQERLRLEVIAMLKSLVKQQERKQAIEEAQIAVQTAGNASYDLDAT